MVKSPIKRGFTRLVLAVGLVGGVAGVTATGCGGGEKQVKKPRGKQADKVNAKEMLQQARARNSELPIIARSHSDEETVYLKSHGATKVIMGEEEIGLAMLAELSRL